jgi:thiamine biosynthesis protein ThiS
MLIVNNRDKIEWHDGMTVRDVLKAMNYDYALITVTVNGTVVMDEQYAAFPVPDGADVSVFHLAHGG